MMLLILTMIAWLFWIFFLLFRREKAIKKKLKFKKVVPEYKACNKTQGAGRKAHGGRCRE